MSLLDLALRNIAGSSFRSSVVVVCALLVSGFALTTTLIIWGAEQSLRLNQARLGADIVVVPQGTETKVEGALLMGQPATVWMPADSVASVARVGGVAAASPQLFLSSLADASCCSASHLFIVAFDPRTDFTVQPWLETNLRRPLALGEGIGGHLVFVPEGDDYIKLYGYFVTLSGNLEATGTGLDQTLFTTFDTAREMSRISRSRAEQPLEIPANSISAVMVRVAPGADVRSVALHIIQDVPGVTPLQSLDLYQSVRKQMGLLVRGIGAVLVITWALSILFIGLVFSIGVNERRREIGVLRALGSTRRLVFQSILGEAAILALAGGLLGIAVFGLATYLFHDLIVATLGIPFLLPRLDSFATMVGGGLVLALASVGLAALLPAIRVSLQDPAIAMRE